MGNSEEDASEDASLSKRTSQFLPTSYEHLLTIYIAETERMWTRNNWMTGVQAALLAAAAVAMEATPRISLAISVIGGLSAVLWFLMAKKQRWWRGVWLRRLRELEGDALGETRVLRPDKDRESRQIGDKKWSERTKTSDYTGLPNDNATWFDREVITRVRINTLVEAFAMVMIAVWAGAVCWVLVTGILTGPIHFSEGALPTTTQASPQRQDAPSACPCSQLGWLHTRNLSASKRAVEAPGEARSASVPFFHRPRAKRASLVAAPGERTEWLRVAAQSLAVTS